MYVCVFEYDWTAFRKTKKINMSFCYQKKTPWDFVQRKQQLLHSWSKNSARQRASCQRNVSQRVGVGKSTFNAGLVYKTSESMRKMQ
jgi:hypothetical protein